MSRRIEHVIENAAPDSLDYSFDRKTLEEYFSETFLARTATLNQIIADSGESLEGGIFYWNADATYLDRPPEASLAPARRNLWRAVRFKKSMLEIGVNACHSALLSLSASPDLIYYGVDINWHKYTATCVEFLQQEFPGRVFYFPGDSREMMPRLATSRPDLVFDLFHVDGGHSAEICYTDISNCLRLAARSRNAHLLLDDINASWIFDSYCEFVANGYLQTEDFFGDWEDMNRNVLARIIAAG